MAPWLAGGVLESALGVVGSPGPFSFDGGGNGFELAAGDGRKREDGGHQHGDIIGDDPGPWQVSQFC